MASPRKSPSRARAAKPAKKAPAARPKTTVARAGKGGVKAKTARPAAAKKSAKPAPKKPVRAIAVKGKAAPPVKKGSAPPPAASKGPRARPRAVARPPAPGPEVRPLGMLPPEARARGLQSHGIAGLATRPAPARATAEIPRNPGAQRVTERDLKEIERLLLDERQRLMKEMGHLESTVFKVNPRDSAGDLSGYSYHMADAGTDAYEREKAFQIASKEGRALMELDDALRRLYRGEYGACESCGRPIGKERLKAVPSTRLCRDCKEKEEREHRQQQQ